MQRMLGILWENFVERFDSPRTVPELRTALRKAGQQLELGLNITNQTMKQFGYGKPFSDAAPVGYVAGYLIHSVSHAGSDIQGSPYVDTMFSVLEELLSSNEIYTGSFRDLVQSAKHRDAVRHDFGFAIGVREFRAFKRKRTVPCGLIIFSSETFNRGQDRASAEFDSYLAAQVPTLFGDKKEPWPPKAK
jgi:hypothetical protein